MRDLRIWVVLQDYRRSYSRSSPTTLNFYSTSCWSWTAGSGGMKKVPTVTPSPILLTRCYLAWSQEWSFDMQSSLSACVHFFQQLQFGRRPLYSTNSPILREPLMQHMKTNPCREERKDNGGEDQKELGWEDRAQGMSSLRCSFFSRRNLLSGW